MQEHYQERIQDLPFSPDDLPAMKADIAQIVTTSNDKSLLAALAEDWGAMPWWAKALILLLLLAPTVILAVVLQLWILFAATAFIGLVYIGLSLLFDNHYAHNAEHNQLLQQKVSAFVDFYGKILVLMHQIASSLGFEVDSLENHNQALCEHNQHLKDEIRIFSSHLTHCKQGIADLDLENSELKISNRHLKDLGLEYEQLLQTQEQELRAIQSTSKAQQELLNEQVDAAKIMNLNFSLQSQKAQKIISTLQTSQSAFLALDKTKEASVKNFDEKLQNLLDTETANLLAMGQKIVDLERKVINSQSETVMLNKEYKQIIEAEKAKVAILENILQGKNPEQHPKRCSLQANSLFATRNLSEKETLPARVLSIN